MRGDLQRECVREIVKERQKAQRTVSEYQVRAVLKVVFLRVVQNRSQRRIDVIPQGRPALGQRKTGQCQEQHSGEE